MTKEEAKNKIQLLIDKFSSQKDYYKSTNYNETQTRQDFINPFFTALGWDLDNTKEQLETYRDVRHEDKIKVNGHTKAPDYSFNINGKRKFFVEAKKPSVSIRENPMPALQVRNYAWNGGLSVSILTDFEELAIYDCTRKPRNVENANAKRLKYIYYTDYIKEFDFIWDTFNFDNVTNGSIEKYAKSKINFKNAEPVDKEFLKTLEKWREDIAVSIALNNKQLDEEELNFTVQQTIDRIVFLKVCEDRKIEKENNLLKTIKSGNYYQNLYTYFQIADQKYNSGLFDFKKDTITKNIVIENRIIKRIITKLYGKNKEEETDFGFNFAIIPVEILGFAYEQFLGKVIKLNPAHRAEIEEKPEVRKAGGVYYTPEYIVEYIVKQTVGELIDNKTPDEISQIKILDPSCGSGSFLLGAYQYLLDYHLKYYNQLRIKNYELRNSKKKLELLLTPEGNLSSQEKKRILLNNIFGVDIDAQAVEVTKLSLLLKALEGETDASIQTSLQIFNERVLPTLDDNIQCGNSLIAPDFYNDGLFLTPKEERKINVFDWNEGFPEVFKQGGFDCVIGNPPYILLQILEKKEIFNYTSTKYNSAHYKIDTYQLFIENSVNLLKPDGYLAYITPNTFLKNIHSEPLRRFILENTVIKEFLLFYYGVFDQASVDVCISLVKRSKVNGNNLIKIKEAREIFNPVLKREIEQTTFNANNRLIFNISVDKSEKELIDKITNNTNPLSKYCSAYFGIQTWDRKTYVSTTKLNENYQPIIDGGNIDRYTLKPIKDYVLFTPEAIKSGGNEKIYRQDRLCTRQIGNYPLVTYVEGGIFALNTIYNIYKTNETTDLKFILGIINSKVINYYWQKTNYDEKKTFPKIKKEAILNIPIPELDFTNKIILNQYEQLIKLVDTILDLNKRLQGAKLQTEKDQLKRRIDFTDKEIDKLVYKLYNLTEEEIEIIEGKNA